MDPSNRLLLLALATGILSGVGGFAIAQSPPQCADEKSRQFDFWIGEWEVYSGDDLAGHNTIEPILGGCVLRETWSGAKGSAGSSFNFYNPQLGRWQQFWVWRNGTTLELAGGIENGEMVLEGESEDGEGNPIHNRITWSDNADGTVRQHWETSTDAGKTWHTAFDGLYRKKR